MKKIISLCLFISLGLNIPTLFAQDAFFRYVKAPVSIVSADGMEEVAGKDSVAGVGDTIVVKEGGLGIVELEDRSIIKIESGSKLTLEELVKEEKEEEYIGVSNVVLKLGSIFVEVAQKFSDAPILNIKNTNSVALGVRGTELFAGVDEENGDFYTSVKSGEVEVYDEVQDDSDSIKAGESMVVERGKQITRPANFEWSKRLRWHSSEEGGSDFRNLRHQARQEFMGKAGSLRNRQRQPAMQRVRQWKAQGQRPRRAQEKLHNLLENRRWKETPSQLKRNRHPMMKARQQKALERRGQRNKGNGGNEGKRIPGKRRPPRGR